MVLWVCTASWACVLGTHGGMALRAASCLVSKPDSDSMLPHYILQLQLEPVTQQGV